MRETPAGKDSITPIRIYTEADRMESWETGESSDSQLMDCMKIRLVIENIYLEKGR